MGNDPFIQKKDALGRMGINPLVKMVAVQRYIAYGISYDAFDETFAIGESTLPPMVRQYLPSHEEAFWKAIFEQSSHHC